MQISSAASLRDPGFVLDTQLSFREQIELISNKGERIVHSLFKYLRTNSVLHLLSAYKSWQTNSIIWHHNFQPEL